MCSHMMHVHLDCPSILTEVTLTERLWYRSWFSQKRGYLIRKQARRQIFCILALYLKFFFPSSWYSGVFSLSWYKMDQGWVNLHVFVRPGWRGLCGLSAHSSSQAPFGLGHLGFWPCEWPPTQDLKGRARTEHYWRHQDYCGLHLGSEGKEQFCCTVTP